jgi:hypothetical protein
VCPKKHAQGKNAPLSMVAACYRLPVTQSDRIRLRAGNGGKGNLAELAARVQHPRAAYLASSFVSSSDGHGGTLITDPLPSSSSRQQLSGSLMHDPSLHGADCLGSCILIRNLFYAATLAPSKGLIMQRPRARLVRPWRVGAPARTLFGEVPRLLQPAPLRSGMLF